MLNSRETDSLPLWSTDDIEFNMQEAPLICAGVYEKDGEKFFKIQFHHSLMDGWSLGLKALLEASSVPKNVLTFNIAGEPLVQNIIDDLYNLNNIQKVYNLYGPTECTTYATYFLAERNSKEVFISIGAPLSNVKTIVVDEKLQPVSPDIKGEILISRTMRWHWILQ